MSWFSFRRKGISDDQLRTALFDAAASGDTRKVESLVSRHRERVAALFPSWTTVPAEVRSDPHQRTWWAEGAIGVAKAAARLGDNSMIARLVGQPGDNPIIEWRNALRSPLADSTSGHYMSAIRILEDILEQTRGLTGSGVDDLLPKSYGLLGTVYYLAGHRDTGRTYTVKAKEYCERIGDLEGVEVYSTHLRNIDAETLGGMSTSNDSDDQRLFEELRVLAEGYGRPGETLEETLVTFWKNPKATAIRERLRLQGVSDDRINREAFRRILRECRQRELVLELQDIAKSFERAAILVTYGDGRGSYVQADQPDTFRGFHGVLQQLLQHMDAGGLPLGIVGVTADGLVCSRPLKEFADKVEVLTILEKAAANISRQNPPGSAN